MLKNCWKCWLCRWKYVVGGVLYSDRIRTELVIVDGRVTRPAKRPRPSPMTSSFRKRPLPLCPVTAYSVPKYIHLDWYCIWITTRMIRYFNVFKCLIELIAIVAVRAIGLGDDQRIGFGDIWFWHACRRYTESVRKRPLRVHIGRDGIASARWRRLYGTGRSASCLASDVTNDVSRTSSTSTLLSPWYLFLKLAYSYATNWPRPASK